MAVSNTVNGVNVEALVATLDAVIADETLGQFRFRARNHWIDGAYNRTTIQDFYGVGEEDASRTEPFIVDSDEPPVLLGRNQAPNAAEFALHALAACLTSAIVYHAAARGIVVDGLECTLEGDVDLRGFLGIDESVRPGFQDVRVTFRATGDFDDVKLAELAALTRFSPVRDIFANPVPVAIDVVRA